MSAHAQPQPDQAPNSRAAPDADALLRVRDLITVFDTPAGLIRAVDGISFDVRAGETVAIVGESGSGKSMTALSIMRLVPGPHGRIARGSIEFEGRNLLSLSASEMRKIRGNDISMVFQDPMSSLNPVFTVGNQLRETIRLHTDLGRREADERAVEALRQVGIPAPEQRLKQYPHELSGGMRQRVMIAMALVCEPTLLIADEPTTALDVTIEAQILDLLRELRAAHGLSLILVTHDLGVVADMADRVLVCYAGHIVEEAPVHELFAQPLHPYTEGLLHSIPSLDTEVDRLHAIEGTVPDPKDLGDSCPFAPRCPYAIEECVQALPALRGSGQNRKHACIRADELELDGVAQASTEA